MLSLVVSLPLSSTPDLTDKSGCDGNDPKNPMNWKAGGTRSVNVGGKAKYWITPLAQRHSHPTSVKGDIDCSGLTYTLWGAGWSSNDFGKELKSQFNGCLGSGYEFVSFFHECLVLRDGTDLARIMDLVSTLR